MSVELVEVSFYKKSLWRKNLERTQSVTGPCHLQIWTDFDLTDVNRRETKFDINLAILSPEKLWDAECESQILN